VPKPLAVVPELEVELDNLYAARPTDFIRTRNDLAKRLTQAGQVEAAAGVKQLRKPTVPLWAVNQLARRHPDDVRALLDAGERLRVAQLAALRGESEELRTATAEERKILHGLTQRGAELLRETGHSADAKRIADTLRAAAVDESGRELLQRGRLSDELEASGFGSFAGMELPARSKAQVKTEKAPPSPAVQRRREEKLRKLRERVTKAKREAAKAERAATRAEASLAEARHRVAQANESVRRAEVELGQGET
jgi:G:T/U-mismatch repair DNA glycosylase